MVATQTQTQIQTQTKQHIWLAVCLSAVIALALALGLMSMPGSPGLTHDSANFLSAAENMAKTGRFIYSVPDTLSQKQFEETNAYMPGYQVVVAGLLTLGLPAEVALYVITLCGLLALVAATFGLGWQLSDSVWGGALAAIWTLSMSHILDVMTYALTESLFIPLTVLALLLAAMYLKQPVHAPMTRRDYVLLGLTAFVTSWSPMTRAFGLGLVPAICGPFLLRSLRARQYRRMAFEFLVGVVAVLPTFANMAISYVINGCAYCGVTPKRVDLSEVGVTREWIAKLMLSNFIPELQLNFGLRGLLRNPIALVLVAALVLAVFVVLWKQRSGIRRVFVDVVNWPRWPLYLFIAIYLVFIFGTSTPGVYVAFNYPRYLVPLYPLFIVLIVALWVDLYRRFPSPILRAGLAVLALAYGIGTAQATRAFVGQAQIGRGIETASVRNHPALAWVRQHLRESDVIFSTKAPTVWYYARQPTHRLDGVEQLHCSQLAKPETGGRSVFVLFPFYVFKGNPTDQANVDWFKNWIAPCGQVAEMQLFNSEGFDNAAVYIVEAKP